MPFFSFGEDAFGVIAIGGNAVGIIAIGGFARGVIAIGGVAVGAIALSLFASFGLIAIGGVTTSVGLYAIGGNPIGVIVRGAGLGLGLVHARITGVAVAWKAEAVGLPISIGPADSVAEPPPPPSVPLPVVLDGADGWVRAVVIAVGEQRATIREGKLRAELPVAAGVALRRGAARVHVRPEARPRDAGGYREESAERPPTIVDAVTPAQRPFWSTRAGHLTNVAIGAGLYYGVVWVGGAVLLWALAGDLIASVLTR